MLSKRSEKAEILDARAMGRAIVRISFEILERNKGIDRLCLVGVKSRGVYLAQRIAHKIQEVEGIQVPVGLLDITPFRDDRAGSAPCSDSSEIPFPVEGSKVILIDDVIFTGRSARAAIDALMSRGRPVHIQLAVLVDRGHRELPIRPDFVGKNLPTAREEVVQVMMKEADGVDRVAILYCSGQEEKR